MTSVAEVYFAVNQNPCIGSPFLLLHFKYIERSYCHGFRTVSLITLRVSDEVEAGITIGDGAARCCC